MLRRQTQQIHRVKQAVFIGIAFADHAFHAVVLKRGPGFIKEGVAFHHDFTVRVCMGGRHLIIGHHEHGAHHNLVTLTLRAAVHVLGKRRNAAGARTAKNAAAQDELHGISACNICIHPVDERVELIRLAAPAGVFQRTEHIGKEQYAKIRMPAEALAVLQLHLRGGEQRACQQLVRLMVLRHLRH